MTLLQDICTFLSSKDIVQGDGIDVFRDFSPEKPDDVVVLYEYKGDPSSPFDTIVHRSVQVTARSNNPERAREKATAIYKALYSDTNFVQFTAKRWAQVYLRQTPYKLYTDENGRAVYGFNIGVTTEIKQEDKNGY